MSDDAELPPPPVPADCDLRDFQFMPLDVSRLRRSKAWLICKRRPDLAFYKLNLWTAAWHEKPAGSLEDDDDVLADLAMCPPKEWPRLRVDVLRGWTKCSDGRLYHPVVVEKAIEAWRSKLEYAYDKECDRLRKAASRAGTLKSLVLPSFEDWQRGRTSSGQVASSNGQLPLSIGQARSVLGTSQLCPPENALKGQGQGQGDSKNPLPPRGSVGAKAPVQRKSRDLTDRSLAVWRAALPEIDRVTSGNGTLTWNDARIAINDPVAHEAIEQTGGYKRIADRDRFTETKIRDGFRERYEQLLQRDPPALPPGISPATLPPNGLSSNDHPQIDSAGKAT